LFPERVYTFKHALTHEVAYSSLLQERRRALHAQIVEVLDTLSGDQLVEQVEKLAHHAFRGEVWDKAYAYSRQAGTRAMTRSAHREAVWYFEQALAALQHLPERRDTRERAIDLRFELRHVLQILGEPQQLSEHLREAETLAEAVNDQRRLGWVCNYMTHHLWYTGHYDRAIASGQRALALAGNLDDFALQVTANFYLSLVYSALGDYRQALVVLRCAIASLQGDVIYERQGLAGLPSVLFRSRLGLCLAELGAFAEGIAQGDEAVHIAEVVDQPYSLVLAYGYVGRQCLRKGDLDQAIPVLERSLALGQEANVRDMLPMLSSALGDAYSLSGRVAEALPLLEQAAEQVAFISKENCAPVHASLSAAYLLTGRLEEASAVAERALAFARADKGRGHQAWTLRLLGEIASHRDSPEIEHAEALTLANELGMRPLQAHCHRGLGTMYSQTGQSEQARAALSTAIDMYRDMEMTFWLPETEAALVDVEGR
jgi:tetratricopeptide (TPR) repeat protein